MTWGTILISAWTIAAAPARQPDPVRVVTTLPIYAELVREVGGAEVEVSSIANPNEDAHFVRPKPSFALDLRRADAFVTTGLDLELWVPTLLDRAGSTAVLEGGRGYITAYTGIQLLDIPVAADRSAGRRPHLRQPAPHDGSPADVADRTQHHGRPQAGRAGPGRPLRPWAGGPHRPHPPPALRGPAHRAPRGRDARAAGAERQPLRVPGGQRIRGRAPLIGQLGGWLAAGESFRNQQIICYHKNWAYLEERFQVRCADYVESKPGIPPTPGHVAELIRRMRSENLNVLLAATYFDAGRVETVASRGGASVVHVPLAPGAAPGIDDYFSLVDAWIEGLSRAFSNN